MTPNELVVESIGRHLADAHGYSHGGADALRFFLLNQSTLPARQVLSMRTHELLEAYGQLDCGSGVGGEAAR